MRSYDAATLAYLSARKGTVARTLVWLSANDRSTGVTETLGFWDGDDAQTFTIGAETRVYYGAGAVMAPQVFTMQVGLKVRMQTVELSPLAPEVAQAVRGYDLRLAPCEIHRAFFDADTLALVGPPTPISDGWVDEAPITTPQIGDTARVILTLASNARGLTKSLATKKSDETQKLKGGDRFRRWADVAGRVPAFWGEDKVATPTQKQVPAPVPPAGGY